MRPIWIILPLILSSCATYSRVEDKDIVVLPKAKDVSLSQKTFNPVDTQIDTDELRVGFIERGKIESFDKFKEFKNTQFKQFGDRVVPVYIRDFKGNFTEIESPTPQDYEDHAEAVLYAFLKNIHTSKKIIIYSCSLGTSRNRELEPEEKCWNWMKDNKVTAINISYEILYVTKNEQKTIFSLLDQGVIITNAAGNDHEVASGLCTFKGIYCVGALSENKVASYSNHGPLVNAWEDGDLVWQRKTTKGTSISAPKFLAKKLSSK